MGPSLDDTVFITIAVPVRLQPDLEALIKALGGYFKLTRWSSPRPAEKHAIVLIDLRAPHDAEAFEMAASTPELIVVADAASSKRAATIPARVLCALSPDWEPDFAAQIVLSRLERRLHRVRSPVSAAGKPPDSGDPSQEGAQQPTDLARLEVELAERTVDLEDRTIELTLKNHELSRLSSFKEGVLRQIGDPDTGHIAEILRCAQEISGAPGAASNIRTSATRLQQVARNIEQVFRPYDFCAKAATALSGKSILVVVRERATRNLLVRALLGTGARIQGVEALEEATRMLGEMKPDILYTDWHSAPILNEAQKLERMPQGVLMTSQPVFELYGKDMLDLPLSNLLIMKELGTEHDPLVIQELVITAGKLLSGDIFGLEKYLAWGTAIREELVTGSVHAREVVNSIDDFLTRASYRGTIKNSFCVLADELMSNAMWDAPADEHGQGKYDALRRTGSLELLPHERPLVRFGSDGNLLGISVSDPFGRLERDHVRRYLVKCFAKGADQVDRKPGGAGLGLYMSLLAVSTLVINVAPKRRTEVIGLVNVHPIRKEAGGKQRSFMYFRTP